MAATTGETIFAHLVEHTPDLIYRYRYLPEPGFEYVSPSATAMTGYTPEEHYADPELGFKLVHPDDVPLLRELARRPAESFAEPLVLRWVRKDGRILWTEQRNIPVYDAEGQIVAIDGIARDITQRKLAEQSADEHGQRYQSVIAAMAEGIVIQDAEGQIETCNPSAERILGLTRDQMMGRTSADPRWRSVHEDGSPFPDEMHPSMVTLRTGQPLTDVIMGVHKPDGSLSWISINTQPIKDAEHVPPRAVVASFRDVTEQFHIREVLQNANEVLEAQVATRTADLVELNQQLRQQIEANQRTLAALRESEEKFRLVTETIPDVFWMGTPGLEEILYVSPAYETIWDRTCASLYADPLSFLEAIHPEDLDRVRATLIEQVEEQWDIAYRILRPAGEVRWIHSRSYPIFNEDGNLVHFAGVVSDITARKRAEEALKHRLYAITNPDGKLGDLQLTDIIDVNQLQSLMTLFYAATHIPVGILDVEGNILVATGWREICTRFHRQHPQACQRCHESDSYIQSHLYEEDYVAYKCQNGMWDIAIPIMIHEQHLATLFLGQFFYEDEKPDVEYFRRQAEEFGFDEDAYLAALADTFVFTRQQVKDILAYYSEFVRLISNLGHTNFQLARDIVARQQAETALRHAQEKLEARVAARTEELQSANTALKAEIAERQRIEQALLASEERLRIIFDYASVGVVLGTPEGRFSAANPAFCDMLGYTVDELSGMTFIDITYPEDIPRERAIIPDLVRGVVPAYQIEKRYIRKDGEVIWVRANISCRHTAEGEVEYFIGVAENITQLKKIEIALRQSETRYKRLVEGSPDIVYAFSDQRGCVYCSARVEAILGYSVDYLLAHPYLWNASIHAEDRPRVVQAIAAFGEGVPFDLEYRIRDREGAWHWFRDRSIGRRVMDEEVIVEGLASDVTHQKEIQTALRDSEARYRLLVEQARDAVYLMDLDGEFHDVNAAACQALGYDRETLLKLTITDVDMTYDLERARVFWNGLSDGSSTLIETVHRRKDGTTFPVEVNATKFAVGEQWMVLGLARDITERKQTEQALERANQELAIQATALEEANEELSQYAYVVSHDVRAPLRAIHNYADFILEDFGTQATGDLKLYLDGLLTAVQEAETLVGDLLALSRIGRQHDRIEDVDMGDLLRDLLTVLDLPNDVDVILPETWPTLRSSPLLLRQIFQNLLDNAIKFNTAERKRVTFEWRAMALPATDVRDATPGFEFSVRDNGIGISPRYHAQIFRVFERLHTSEAYPGTGIGLAIVRKAVTRLGGEVRVASEPGQGSTFFVSLPAQPLEDDEL